MNNDQFLHNPTCFLLTLTAKSLEYRLIGKAQAFTRLLLCYGPSALHQELWSHILSSLTEGTSQTDIRQTMSAMISILYSSLPTRITTHTAVVHDLRHQICGTEISSASVKEGLDRLCRPAVEPPSNPGTIRDAVQPSVLVG